jgi:uncharacterized protein (TIGR03437 family)
MGNSVKSRRIGLGCILALCLVPWLTAQAPVSLLNGDPLTVFSISGAPADHYAVVDASGPGFTRAMRIRTPSNPQANPWDLRIWTNFSPNATAAANAGDTGLAKFYARAVESTRGRAFARFVIERAGSPYNKAANWAFSVGPEWTLIEIPFVMDSTYRSGEYNVHFWVTFEPQVIEIGGLTVRNFGPQVPFAQLPLSAWPNYEGHAPDAPWRSAAAQRIEQHRKGSLRVQVHDAQGRGIPGVPVRVRMQQHAFPFGTAVAAAPLLNDATYQRVFRENFNSAVIENDLKWPGWERDRNPGLNALDWLAQQGMREVRGHNVIWPGWQFMPADVQGLAGNPEALRTRVNNRIDDVVSATRGKLYEWDVVNEPLHERDLQQVLGDAELYQWMRRARQQDPDAKLYLNDYDILTHGGVNLTLQDRYLALLQSVRSQNAPIDGLGLQGHFGNNVTPPEQVLQILDRFAATGLAIKITEFDIDTTDEQLQADYTRDFLTAVFSHPDVDGFLMWGFWAGRHWLPSAALFRLDWSAKPNALVWRDLVYNQWWTNQDLQTDANGDAVLRGFLGRYAISVEAGDGEKQQTVELQSNTQESVVSFTAVPEAPTLPANGIVNAASFAGGAVAPGEIVTLFGEHFGAPALQHAGYQAGLGLSREVAHTRVLFDGVPAPLLYSFRSQVSAIVPYGVKTETRVQMEYLGQRSPELTLPVTDAAPGIFCLGQDGKGQAVAVNFEGGRNTLNGSDRPIARGDILTLFITGEGSGAPAVAEGVLPPAGSWPRPLLPVRVLFGEAEGTVEFAGLVFAGVTQINVRVPANAPSGGAVPVLVKVGNASTQAGVTVSIQ